MIRVVRGGMEQSELQHLKQQVQGVRLECETLIAQLYACLLKKREHSLWVNQVENQQELSIRILKTRISRSRTGPYAWVSEYCQQELMIKQEQFSAMNRRHAQDAQCLQAEQGLWPRLLQNWATRLKGSCDVAFKRQILAF